MTNVIKALLTGHGHLCDLSLSLSVNCVKRYVIRIKVCIHYYPGTPVLLPEWHAATSFIYYLLILFQKSDQ